MWDKDRKPDLGPGRPLDTPQRQRFSDAWGTDVGFVRIHDGSRAQAAVQRTGGKALTIGHQVAVARPLRPTIPDELLLAHEVAHAVQQRGDGGSPASAAHEADANQAAAGIGATMLGLQAPAQAPRLAAAQGLQLMACERVEPEASDPALDEAVEEAGKASDKAAAAPGQKAPKAPATPAAPAQQEFDVDTKVEGGTTIAATKERYRYDDLAQEYFGHGDYRDHIQSETGVKPNKIQVPDAQGRGRTTQIRVPEIEIPRLPASAASMLKGGTPAYDASKPGVVPVGQETFDAEGFTGLPDRTLVPHWPGSINKKKVVTVDAGVTIGRGYDMWKRTATQVNTELVEAGIPKARAKALSAAAGKHGADAKAWAKKNAALTITAKQEYDLFINEYNRHLGKALTTVSRWETPAAKARPKGMASTSYQKYAPGIAWGKLDRRLIELLIDLRYKGNLTKANWNLIEPSYRANRVDKALRDLVPKLGGNTQRQAYRTKLLADP